MLRSYWFSCIVLVVFATTFVCGQATTPNIGLYVPGHNYQQWDVPLNTNFSMLDLMLSGHQSVPGFLPDWLILKPNVFSAVFCNSGVSGKMRIITDSPVTSGAITSGGGTNEVLSFCNGTNWWVGSGPQIGPPGPTGPTGGAGTVYAVGFSPSTGTGSVQNLTGYTYTFNPNTFSANGTNGFKVECGYQLRDTSGTVSFYASAKLGGSTELLVNIPLSISSQYDEGIMISDITFLNTSGLAGTYSYVLSPYATFPAGSVTTHSITSGSGYNLNNNIVVTCPVTVTNGKSFWGTYMRITRLGY